MIQNLKDEEKEELREYIIHASFRHLEKLIAVLIENREQKFLSCSIDGPSRITLLDEKLKLVGAISYANDLSRYLAKLKQNG